MIKSITIDGDLTVAELIEILQRFPPDALVQRQITNEFGKTEIDEVRVEDNKLVVID